MHLDCTMTPIGFQYLNPSADQPVYIPSVIILVLLLNLGRSKEARNCTVICIQFLNRQKHKEGCWYFKRKNSDFRNSLDIIIFSLWNHKCYIYNIKAVTRILKLLMITSYSTRTSSLRMILINYSNRQSLGTSIYHTFSTNKQHHKY